MIPVILHLRTAYLLAHEFHHNTTGCTFKSDHAQFEEHYEAYSEAYDTLVERAIGLGLGVNEAVVNKSAALAAAATRRGRPGNPDDMFKIVLSLENELLDKIKECYAAASIGTQNTLAQLADDSERRICKLKGRIGV